MNFYKKQPYTGVYLTFTTGRKIRKLVSHIRPQTVYVYTYTLENIQQND